MNIAWSEIKEGFFAIGSIAGVLALVRPLLESRFARDAKRAEHVLSMIDEQSLVDLEGRVYQTRQVPDDHFHPFQRLSHERRTGQDAVRFGGPLSKHFLRELDALIGAYAGLREYIQADEWEPRSHRDVDGNEYTSWDFNKGAFSKQTGYPKDYAQHLDGAAAKAAEMLKAYQRFQVVTELHLFEAPIAGWMLRRRFKEHEL